MQNWTVNDLVKACGGVLLCGDKDTPVEHISLDSRKMEGSDLFVPLIGEKVDAHRFIRQALENGAAVTLTSEHEVPAREFRKTDAGEEDAAVVHVLQEHGAEVNNGTKQPVPAGDDGVIGFGKAWIAVDDTKLALQAIGRAYRRTLTLPLIGITGSVGKTTTKEMVAAALSAGLRVYKTYGSRNSQVGVPITITDIDKEEQIGVIELGMSEPGELTVIAEMAQVDVAAITNIGVAHIEQLGSQENIFREKMTIQNGLKDGGILLLNGDDPFLKDAKAKPGCRTLYYGMGENCDYRAVDVRLVNGYPTFTAVCGRDGKKRVEVRLKVMGSHQVQNAMVALAAADLYGVDLKAAAESLGQFAGMKGRQQVHHFDGITLIDDTYNANPVSMKGAIDNLTAVEDCSRRIALLADMKELGTESARFHREVGEYLGARPIGLLVTYGELAKEIEAGARKANPKLLVRHFEESEKEEMERWIAGELKAGDCILMKGSNSMNLGEAADYVCQRHH